MKTINKSFNEAWALLKKYHEEGRWLPNGTTIDLQKRPKFKSRKVKITVSKKDDEWRWYLSALQKIIIIGQRNGWLQIHVDGQGFGVFLYVFDEFNKEKT